MAISVSSIAASFSDADQSTSYVTGTITLTTGKAYFLWLFSSRSAADPPDGTVSGLGLTWTQLGSLAWATDASFHRKIQLFKGVGTPTSGALTFAFGGTAMTSCGWNVCEATGVDTTNPIVSGSVVSALNNTAGTSGSVTLNAAAGGGNLPISWFGHGTSEVTTPRTNWTELSDVQPISPGTGVESQWRSDAFETTASASWATSSKWGGMAAELSALTTAFTQTVSATQAQTATAPRQAGKVLAV